MAEDIGLLGELLADSRVTRQGCQVCYWLKDRDDAAEWDTAFRDDRITSVALTNAMRRRGFTFKDKPVQTHRKEQHRVG